MWEGIFILNIMITHYSFSGPSVAFFFFQDQEYHILQESRFVQDRNLVVPVSEASFNSEEIASVEIMMTSHFVGRHWYRHWYLWGGQLSWWTAEQITVTVHSFFQDQCRTLPFSRPAMLGLYPAIKSFCARPGENVSVDSLQMCTRSYASVVRLSCRAKHWQSSYCFTPNDHQVARIFLVLIQPIRRALSKWPSRRWFCLHLAADDPFLFAKTLTVLKNDWKKFPEH